MKKRDDIVKNLILICNTCRKLFNPNEPRMQIQTEKALMSFCAKCIKKSYGELARRKLENPDEINLLIGMRRFLNSIERKPARG